ncbi:unnamed protein product [Merluccius merluccius]
MLLSAMWLAAVAALLPGLSWAQRSEPMFSSVTQTVLPPDYDNNPTQLNYGVAVTDVDGDGDLEIFVAGPLPKPLPPSPSPTHTQPQDQDECTQFPSVCPPDRPVCTNTYGGFKCRSNKRCSRGFQPNDDGSACVAQVAYFGGTRSSGVQRWPGRSLWPLSASLLPFLSAHLQTGLL